MKLDYHIAYRMINDPKMIDEIMELQAPIWLKLMKATPMEKDAIIKDNIEDSMKALNLFQLLDPEGCKYYFITDSVTRNMDRLKVSKRAVVGHDMQYDWTVFAHVPMCKKAFIFGTGDMFIFEIKENDIVIFHNKYDTGIKKAIYGRMGWTCLFADRKTGVQAEHFNSLEAQAIEETIYKILCFFYLSENTEEILKPGQKQGTKKNGKIINSLKIPLIIVNTKWNVTSIRNEGFQVSGHFAIRWSGEGRKIAKMVFIEPFEKHGYIRRAKNETVNEHPIHTDSVPG